MRILLVDDYDASARTLQKLFERSGHETIVANDSSQALAAAKAFVPDVVITDILMPGMDGYNLAKALREDDTLSARIVGLSAYTSSADDPRSQYLDVQLQKPIAFRRLLAAALGE
jgi:CheY-like chemotaxis protein